jgi:hypothetical protein
MSEDGKLKIKASNNPIPLSSVGCRREKITTVEYSTTNVTEKT